MATTATREEIEQAGRFARLEMAKREYRRFMPFVKIVEPGTGMVTLQEWPHLMEVEEALRGNSRIVLAKSRQIGMTTLLSSYVL